MADFGTSPLAAICNISAIISVLHLYLRLAAYLSIDNVCSLRMYVYCLDRHNILVTKLNKNIVLDNMVALMCSYLQGRNNTLHL